jgi:acyl-CoA synthetase (AMP-forming)/AMP-acid ligase II
MARPGLDPVPAGALFDSLDRWAEQKPDAEALRFVRDLGGESEAFSYADVQALRLAGARLLASQGIGAGQRVLLDLPTDERFVAAILGAFHLGAWPASVAPMEVRRGEAAEQEWRHHLEVFAPDLIISAGTPPESAVPLLAADAFLEAHSRDEPAPPCADPQSMRYVQFSSGSTGSPKPIVLGMEGIAFNLERMREHIPIHDDDRVFSWLPMYHDMGLFGTLLLALHTGCQLTLMDPGLFSRAPMTWFQSIDRFRARITVGPPSALKASLELLRRRPPESLDLSSCDRWICGSEQVTPEVMQSFAEVLAPYGMDRKVLHPVYGMAEITLTATLPPPRRVAPVEVIDRARFEDEHRAQTVDLTTEADDFPPSTTETTLGWTGVGQVMPGQACRIVDEDGQVVADGVVGRVELDSPSLYLGTLQGEQFLPREAGWHDTGDLGYLRGDELFITGRRRELIIKNGRNYAPERIEELAATIDGVGRSAAFGDFDPQRQTERAVLVAEAHPRVLRESAQRDQLRLQVRQALARAGYELDEVRLIPRGELPRTTSGKIRRAACRELGLPTPTPRSDS